MVPGCDVQIVDGQGRPVPDGHEGELLVRGPSVAPGYFNDPEATAATFRDGFLHTGDLGYRHQGYLYVTGRVKDLIISNGRNIHPQAVEWIVEQVQGARQGGVVAFSVPGCDTERVVVLVETRDRDQDGLIARVKSAVHRELGLAVEVVCLARGELPKTSSGKVQRQLTRRRYRAGMVGATTPAITGRMARPSLT